MSKYSVLAQEDFERLLAWLDPDRERAGAKYEDIRRDLIKIFTWRGCADADELADEAINRVTQKLPAIAETYEGDPALYFYGVAKKLLLEYFRKGPPARLTQLAEDKSLKSRAAEVTGDAEQEHACLEVCLRRLGAPDRELILLYYRVEKREKADFRRELAERLGLTANTLRVKVHRLRAVLHDCVRRCLTKGDEV